MTECKYKIFAFALVAGILAGRGALAGCDASDPLGAMFSSIFGKDNKNISGVQLTCDPNVYKTKKPACDKCKAAVEKWKEKLPDVAKKASSADKSLSCSATPGMAGAAGEVGSELKAFQSQSAVTSAAKSTDLARSKNAGDAASQFDQCLKDIDTGCKGAMLNGSDKQSAETMQKACQDAKGGAGKFADQKKQDGMSMGDLAKLAQAAGQAMQAMQPQQQGDQNQPAQYPTAATSPTPTSSAPAIETSKMDDKNGVAASTVAFGGATPGNKVDMANTAPGSVTGLASGGQSNNHYGASSDFGAGAGGGSGSPIGSVGGGGGGGGAGGGSLNSSGASRPGDGAAAAASGDGGGGNEFNGGGGFRASGLKPSKGDLADVADGSIPPAGTDTKLDDLGNRDPASENAANDDPLAQDGESIFLRVRQKYSLLKGAGRI